MQLLLRLQLKLMMMTLMMDFVAIPTDDRSDVMEMTADVVFKKKLSPLFVGATNDWNYGVSAGCAPAIRLFVWTSPRFHVVSAAQLMFPFSLSTQVISHCANFALQATCFLVSQHFSAPFFLRSGVCALRLTHKVLCLGLKAGISQCCGIFSQWMPESHQESHSVVLY